MNVNLIITDNFLPNPDHVREQAIQLDYPTTGSFPGLRSLAADDVYQMYIQQRFESILGVSITGWVMDSFCFQLCYEGAETWVHKDQSQWAGVLYLTPNAPQEAGTGLYRQMDNNDFELDTAIGNVYNRLILYRGDVPHRSLLAGFGNTPDTGRLTQVFFFNTKDDPGGGWE
jgi:hypothetical protein